MTMIVILSVNDKKLHPANCIFNRDVESIIKINWIFFDLKTNELTNKREFLREP